MELFKQKILEELSRDARISVSQLSRALRKPRHIIDYHLKTLRKQKIWKDTRLRINYQALGYDEYNLYLRIQNYSTMRKPLALLLEECPYVRWAGSLFPYFSVRINVIVPGAAKLDEVIDELNKLLGSTLLDMEIIRCRSFIKFDMFSTKHNPIETANRKHELSKQDAFFLNKFNQDPLQSFEELGKKCGLTSEGARKKLQRLQSDGIIQAIYAKIDLRKIGRSFASIALMKVNNTNTHLHSIRQLLYSDLVYSRTRLVSGYCNVSMIVNAATNDDFIRSFQRMEELLGKDLVDYEVFHYSGNFLKKRVPPFIFG